MVMRRTALGRHLRLVRSTRHPRPSTSRETKPSLIPLGDLIMNRSARWIVTLSLSVAVTMAIGLTTAGEAPRSASAVPGSTHAGARSPKVLHKTVRVGDVDI